MVTRKDPQCDIEFEIAAEQNRACSGSEIECNNGKLKATKDTERAQSM